MHLLLNRRNFWASNRVGDDIKDLRNPTPGLCPRIWAQNGCPGPTSRGIANP